MKIRVRAPSNIALIKYMGKVNSQQNLPANSSLSMTLDRLCTLVELETDSCSGLDLASAWSGTEMSAQPFQAEWRAPALKAADFERLNRFIERLVTELLPPFFARFEFVPTTFGIKKFSTWNTFPEGAGIASSASSFAALTTAVALASSGDHDRFKTLFVSSLDFRKGLAALSRQGSGSSCRSFLGPWVQWTGENIEPIAHAANEPWVDLVLVFSSEKKKVSSSDAHRRVLTSPLWQGRVDRAEARVQKLKQALSTGDLKVAASLTWEEMWEMHSLFHTSQPPFTYWCSESLDCLNWLDTVGHDDVFVTMDAGPNVHLLVKKSAQEKWQTQLQNKYPQVKVLIDEQGTGVEVLS